MTGLFVALPGVWVLAVVALVAFLRYGARQGHLWDAMAETVAAQRETGYVPRHRADGPPVIGTGDTW